MSERLDLAGAVSDRRDHPQPSAGKNTPGHLPTWFVVSEHIIPDPATSCGLKHNALKIGGVPS